MKERRIEADHYEESELFDLTDGKVFIQEFKRELKNVDGLRIASGLKEGMFMFQIKFIPHVGAK